MPGRVRWAYVHATAGRPPRRIALTGATHVICLGETRRQTGPAGSQPWPFTAPGYPLFHGPVLLAVCRHRDAFTLSVRRPNRRRWSLNDPREPGRLNPMPTGLLTSLSEICPTFYLPTMRPVVRSCIARARRDVLWVNTAAGWSSD